MGFVDHTILLFRKIVYSHLPFTYKHLSQERMHRTALYMMFLIAFSLFLMFIILLPQLWNLSSFFEKQIAKFDSFKLNGEVVQNDPIFLPEGDPAIVIDASGKEQYGDEMFLLTSDYFYFHLFNKPKRIKVANIINPLGHEKEVTAVLMAVVFFLAPSVLFFTYLFLALKYGIMVILASVIVYSIVRIMLLIKISFRKTFNISAYAATPMILIEVITIPYNPKYLFPLFRYFGLTLYATTTLIWLIFLISGFLLVEEGVIEGFVEEDDDGPLKGLQGAGK